MALQPPERGFRGRGRGPGRGRGRERAGRASRLQFRAARGATEDTAMDIASSNQWREQYTPPRSRNIAAAAQESIPATPGAGMTSEQSQAVSANQQFLASNPQFDPGSHEYEFIRSQEPRRMVRGKDYAPQEMGESDSPHWEPVPELAKVDQETYDFLQHLKEQGLYEDNQEIPDWMQEAIDDHLAGVLDEPGDVYASEPEMIGVMEGVPPQRGYGLTLPPVVSWEESLQPTLR